MPKKNKGFKIFIGIMIAVILLSAIGVVSYFGFIKQTGFGGTIISLQQVNYVSSDPTIGGSSWLLTMIQDGASQFARGSFTTDILNSKTNTKEKVKYPLEVTIESTPQVCSYKLNAQSQKISTVEVIDKGKFATRNGCEQACSGLANAFTSVKIQCVPENLFLTLHAYCFLIKDTATYGSIEFDKLAFSSNILAKINNEDFKGTVSNADSKSVSLGDGRVYASWTGSLTSGSDCPRASEQEVSSAYLNGNWRMIDNGRYTNYVNYDANGFDACINNLVRTGGGSKTPQQCVSEYNSYSNLALSPKDFVAVGGTTKIQNSQSSSDGKVEITLGKAIQFPMITMRIRADILGVVVPTSQPKIVAKGSECFTTGSNGFITTTIKNVGDEYATFTVSASCPAPFSQTGTLLTVQLAPSTQQEVNIPITGQGLSEVKKDCTITVADSENPSKKDTASVSACVQPIVLCSSDETRCNGVVREKCNSAGSSWNTIEGDTTCQTTGGGGDKSCKPIWAVASFTIIPNIKCLAFFQTILWVATFLVGFMSLFLVYSFTQFIGGKSGSNNQALSWTVAIIFGVGMAVLTYLLFYIALIIFVLIIIARIIAGIIKKKVVG